MELTSDNVDSVIKDCLYNKEELKNGKTPSGSVVVDGITALFELHPDRLKNHVDEIKDMLGQLPKAFMLCIGGGASFLEACTRADGHLWGEHRAMEALFVLGMGVGMVRECVPRYMWKVLPGGMPYYVVII